jgi:hypothetical protein
MTNKVTKDDYISKLSLGVRSYNCLTMANISTVGEITSRTDRELLRIKHIGTKTLYEIKYALAEHGLALRKRQFDTNRPLRKASKCDIELASKITAQVYSDKVRDVTNMDYVIDHDKFINESLSVALKIIDKVTNKLTELANES